MSRYLGLGNGKDGIVDLSSYTQTWYSCSGTIGTNTVSVTGTFSPGDRLFLHQTRGASGAYEDATVASYTPGTLTLVQKLDNTYTDSGDSQAQIAVVKEASSVIGSYTVGAWNGDTGGILRIACNGLFDSTTIDATGKGFRGGAAITGAGINGRQGEGTLGDSGTQSKTTNGNGAGGGETSTPDAGAGGGGGNGLAGTVGNGTGGLGGLGGLLVGLASLASIFLGGGGGSGSSNADTSGNGGIGGGIVIIDAGTFSNNTVTLHGTNGGGSIGGSNASAGGAGAGGSFFLRAKKIILGTNNVTATGGIGGTGDAHDGGDGAVGRIRVEGCSVTGSTNPTASEVDGGHNWCGSIVSYVF